MATKNFSENIKTAMPAMDYMTIQQPKAAAGESKSGRMNIKFDDDLKDFIEEMCWRYRIKSQNTMVNNIVRAYKEAYEAQEAAKKE